jgi:hypothetical protein
VLVDLATPAVVHGAPCRDRTAVVCRVSRLAQTASRFLPSGELTIRAEDGEYEAMLTITLLDRLPDWQPARTALGRLGAATRALSLAGDDPAR